MQAAAERGRSSPTFTQARAREWLEAWVPTNPRATALRAPLPGAWTQLRGPDLPDHWQRK
jgi:hypothetical protein